MGATNDEANKLAIVLRARFGYSIEVDENLESRGTYYLSLIADFGTEVDLGAFLPTNWVFNGWSNKEQRAMMSTAEKR